MFSIFVITGLSWNKQFQLCIICSCMHVQRLCSHRLITEQAVQQCIPMHVQHLCNHGLITKPSSWTRSCIWLHTQHLCSHRLITEQAVEQCLVSVCMHSIFAITVWSYTWQLNDVSVCMSSVFAVTVWSYTRQLNDVLCLCVCAASLRSSHSQGYCPLSTRSLWCGSLQRRCRPTSTKWPCASTTMRNLTR